MAVGWTAGSRGGARSNWSFNGAKMSRSPVVFALRDERSSQQGHTCVSFPAVNELPDFALRSRPRVLKQPRGSRHVVEVSQVVSETVKRPEEHSSPH